MNPNEQARKQATPTKTLPTVGGDVCRSIAQRRGMFLKNCGFMPPISLGMHCYSERSALHDWLSLNQTICHSQHPFSPKQSDSTAVVYKKVHLSSATLWQGKQKGRAERDSLQGRMWSGSHTCVLLLHFLSSCMQEERKAMKKHWVTGTRVHSSSLNSYACGSQTF